MAVDATLKSKEEKKNTMLFKHFPNEKFILYVPTVDTSIMPTYVHIFISENKTNSHEFMYLCMYVRTYVRRSYHTYTHPYGCVFKQDGGEVLIHGFDLHNALVRYGNNGPINNLCRKRVCFIPVNIDDKFIVYIGARKGMVK